ncbi:TetR/AcrR family transcriptional regulator [Sphingomonas antarctica]|uniref:TetR/AcrR family transcriptional regulator n=1 Tax=Sphingomonas antarctica TaxID=2040274 RepID=UPI0039E737AA
MASSDQPSAKRAAIVGAARTEFFLHGYGATTMSAVAARVGGSKTTLWAYFPSKQELFAAVVDDLVERFGEALDVPLDATLPVSAALRQFAESIMAIVGTPEIIDLHRIVAGEAGRFPELGTLFFERGPKRGKAKLAAYLTTAMADGRVRPGDPMIAARQFAALCQAGLHQDRLWGLVIGNDHARLTADIEAAIACWTRAWAAS